MDYKKIAVGVSLLAVIAGSGGFFWWNTCVGQRPDKYEGKQTGKDVYQAEMETADALTRLKSNPKKAPVISHYSNGKKQIALTFDGLCDLALLQQLLEVLNKYEAKATFFVDGLQASEEPQAMLSIKNAGQKIESYTYSAQVKMDKFTIEQLVADFARGQKVIKVISGQEAALLKCNASEYTEPLLQAAESCHFLGVVKSDVVLHSRQIAAFSSDISAGKIKPGSIVSIKLKMVDEPIVRDTGKMDSKPAVDKQPGLKELPKTVGLSDKEIVDAVERVLVALKKAQYTTAYVEDFPAVNTAPKAAPQSVPQSRRTGAGEEQPGTLWRWAYAYVQEQVSALFFCKTAYAAESGPPKAEEIKVISTTEPALAYSFGGLSNEPAVLDVLERLKKLDIKATFFVTEMEIRKYPNTIRKIMGQGHEIGLGIRPKDGEAPEITRQTILRGCKLLREQFGVQANLVKQNSGMVTDTTKEVVSGLDCSLIGQSLNVIQEKHKNCNSVEQIMTDVFRKSMVSLSRGQIVYFKMDFYTNAQMAGDLLEAVKRDKVDNIAYATFYDNPALNQHNDSAYRIESVGQLLNNTKLIYHFPVERQAVPANLQYTGESPVMDQHRFINEAAKRYIGCRTVNYEDRMFGFSKMEIRHLDMTGLIHTEDNVIFLTFDDWGSDASINKLLYVFRKHKAAGTFFVLTRSLLNNPNLLRVIALQGHDIGGHSDQHKPMVVLDVKTRRQMPTQGKEEYTKELAVEYQKLLSVVGDVTVNGRPALTRYFRPPQLAISKDGMEALFRTGHEYIVSGSYSTNDYRAEGVEPLVRSLENGIYTKNGELIKGAVIVMHMSDNAAYTPEALDILLTANEAKPDSDPTKFKVGRLADYLIEGYSQIDRRKSLKLLSQRAHPQP